MELKKIRQSIPQKEIEAIDKYIANDPQLSKLNPDTAYKYIMLLQVVNERLNPTFSGYYPIIKAGAQYWEIMYAATPAQRQKELREKNIAIKGEDSRDYNASLEKFDLSTLNRKAAKKYAMDIINIMEHNKNADNEHKRVLGLYIHSSAFQIGKTYLANAITNALADLEFTGIFVFAPSLAAQAKEFKELEKLIKELKQTQVLVLDDLGAEYRSEWFRIEILMPVLQNRLTNNKLTIITSNYSILKLSNLYKQQNNSNPIDTDRLISRIMELCREIELDE